MEPLSLSRSPRGIDKDSRSLSKEMNGGPSDLWGFKRNPTSRGNERALLSEVLAQNASIHEKLAFAKPLKGT